MGRPRVHDEETRAALRAAAERLVAEGGPGAFSVRAVAEEVGTSRERSTRCSDRRRACSSMP